MALSGEILNCWLITPWMMERHCSRSEATVTQGHSFHHDWFRKIFHSGSYPEYKCTVQRWIDSYHETVNLENLRCAAFRYSGSKCKPFHNN